MELQQIACRWLNCEIISRLKCDFCIMRWWCNWIVMKMRIISNAYLQKFVHMHLKLERQRYTHRHTDTWRGASPWGHALSSASSLPECLSEASEWLGPSCLSGCLSPRLCISREALFRNSMEVKPGHSSAGCGYSDRWLQCFPKYGFLCFTRMFCIVT